MINGSSLSNEIWGLILVLVLAAAVFALFKVFKGKIAVAATIFAGLIIVAAITSLANKTQLQGVGKSVFDLFIK